MHVACPGVTAPQALTVLSSDAGSPVIRETVFADAACARAGSRLLVSSGPEADCGVIGSVVAA
jgi:hypothetical protein